MYPTLAPGERPLECVQGPGDVVYVPAGWYHAVVNLADSLAVSVQSAAPLPEEQEAFKGLSLGRVRELHRSDPAALAELAEAARAHMAAHPENDVHARRVLFYALSVSRPEEAVRVSSQGESLV